MVTSWTSEQYLYPWPVKHLKLLYMRGYIYSETKIKQCRDKAGHFVNISTSLLDHEEISKQITKDNSLKRYQENKTLDPQKYWVKKALTDHQVCQGHGLKRHSVADLSPPPAGYDTPPS